MSLWDGIYYGDRTWRSVIVANVGSEVPVMILPADPSRVRAAIVHDSAPFGLLWLCPSEAVASTTNADGGGWPMLNYTNMTEIYSNQEVWAICVTGDTAVSVRAITEHKVY
jgi:hypothetical protein